MNEKDKKSEDFVTVSKYDLTMLKTLATILIGVLAVVATFFGFNINNLQQSVSEQILKMEDWFAKIGEPYMTEIERENRRKDRLKSYISCWCMRDFDLDLMWKGYVRNPQVLQ